MAQLAQATRRTLKLNLLFENMSLLLLLQGFSYFLLSIFLDSPPEDIIKELRVVHGLWLTQVLARSKLVLKEYYLITDR